MKLFLILQFVLSFVSSISRNQVENRFYESLGENEQENQNTFLRTMVYDYSNSILYVGAVNRVYALSLESLENVSDSYKSPMDYNDQECLDSCDHDRNDNIQLLVPHDKIIVVCGTARKGQCVRLSSNTLEETTNPLSSPLVSTEKSSQSFGFFGTDYDTNNNLMVATTYRSDQDEHLFHFIKNFHDPIRSKHSTFELSPSAKKFTTINFKGGFTYNGATYFLSNQTGEVSKKSTFISRICHNEPDTFVEIKLICMGGPSNTQDKNLHNIEFDELRQVKVPQPINSNSDNYFNGPLHKSHELMYALFSRSNQKQDVSALCVFNMTDIETQMVDVIIKTLNETHSNNNKYISSTTSARVVNKQVLVTAGDLKKNKCTKLHHHSPISSITTIVHPFLVVSMKNETATALAVRNDEKIVVYVGTSSGKIMKLNVPSKNDKMVHLPLGRQPYPIKDIVVLARDELYALTKKEILKVKTFECDKITSCDECTSDIHCGWCMSTGRCTDSLSSCPVSQHYISDTCVDNEITINLKVLNDTDINFKEFKFPSGFSKVICLYGDPKDHMTTAVEVNPIIKNGEVFCPFILGQMKFNVSRSVNVVPLSLIFDNTTWIRTNLTVIRCQFANSCTECTSLSCTWDHLQLQCLHNATNNTTTTTNIVDGCPTIIRPNNNNNNNNQSTTMIPAGLDKSVSVLVKNVPASYGDIRCSFNGSVKVTPPTSVSSTNKKTSSNVNNVTCSAVQLDYQESIAFKSSTINLMIRDLRNDMKIFVTHTIQVYKCRYLAQNCGQCQSLDLSYGCVWCDNQCELVDKCRKMAASAGNHDNCESPTITSIHPLGGPASGNTLLTISGRNFGVLNNKTEVVIDKNLCKDLKIETSDRLYCKTPRGVSKPPVAVTITRKNAMSVKSSQMFHYQDPVISKMEPIKGLRSGGTMVTITGHNLDFGNNFNVSLKNEQQPIISRTSKELVFQTLPVPVKMPVTFTFTVDGAPISFGHQFQFLEDPVIQMFENPFTIMHGGTLVTFKGLFLNHLNNARLIVHFSDGSNKTGDPCVINSELLMSCPTPDVSNNTNISDSNKIKLHFGLLGCTIKRWIHLSQPDTSYTRTPFKKLIYYKTPEIINLPETFKIKHDMVSPIPIVIKSSNNDLLKRFKELKVLVAGLELKSSSPSNPLSFDLPHYYELEKLGNNFDIILKVGNYRKLFGRVSLSSKTNWARLIGALVGLALGFLTIVIIAYFVFRCYKLKHKSKQQQQHPTTSYDIDNCHVSLPNLREVSSRGEAKAINPYSQRIPGPADEREPFLRSQQDDENYFQNIMQSIEVFPGEGSNIYIPRNKLQLGNLIGRGNFGSVYIATLIGRDETSTTVAVKTIEDTDMKDKSVENFVREGLMMKNFDHPNVMGLYGLCVGYRQEPMVVLPYMNNGDLRSYVKDIGKQFTARELLKLTHQVSQGMTYLSSLNFIHRDLAARNCMIDEHEVVKVADFGLSHELHEKNYYSSRDQKAKLPIKWMALESLESFIFTVKSDVWSFGVLMWEVMTRGITPYPDVEIFETRDYLASGRRLRKPKYCPENVYEIMLKCWSELPENRPSFTDLVNDIEILLNPPRIIDSGDYNYLNQIEMASSPGSENYLRPF